ncbi:MAG TPA: DNA repair exonuclease [Candidatus Dormibacteraeota bacterium]|nr:DNA repair exonuclease [Candidatus Dormibacteraeota bacterium]
MKLVHAADIHLGRRRLDGRLPDQDFAEAFAHVAAAAIDLRADAFLLAGDLFDRAQVEPPHLRQAQQVLVMLKQARIPVIAIEGNHDKAFVHSEAPTWLQYLAEDALLVLLQTRFDKTGPLLTEWQDARNGGAWMDLGGVRFVGAGYLGAATPHKVREIAARLEPNRTHVLLLHAGPDYFIGEGGGFSKEDLESLRQKVCYLALGHIHKPMLHGDWACNPGSPENCDIKEAAYAEPRGYAVVEIDPAQRERPARLEVRSNPRRKCHRLTLDCTEFGNKLKRGAEALVDAAVDLIKLEKPEATAIIELRLTGSLNLDRIALDQMAACAEIQRAAGVAAVTMDTTGLNVAGELATSPAAGSEQNLSHEELEKSAIRRLVEEENLWGLDGRQDEFASLFYELKEQVRAGRTGEELAEVISQSPLLDLIQKASEEQEQREPRDERDKWKEQGKSAAKGFDLMVQVAEVQSEALKA